MLASGILHPCWALQTARTGGVEEHSRPPQPSTMTDLASHCQVRRARCDSTPAPSEKHGEQGKSRPHDESLANASLWPLHF